MSIRIGIDLGATHSCAAYVDKNGYAVMFNNNEDMSSLIPSVVYFDSPTEIVVGRIAKECSVIEPQNTVEYVKLLIGKSDFAIHYNGKNYSPEEISALILKKFVADISLNDSEYKDVVISCPACFGVDERAAIKKAGEIAGFNVMAIISDPIAAALYYGVTMEQNEKTVLLYDLGGAVFDVAVVSLCNGRFQVICSDGDHNLGGKNWDEAIMQYAIDEFYLTTGYKDNLDESVLQELRINSERAKCKLSNSAEAPIVVLTQGAKTVIKLTREKFEEISQPLLDKTIKKTESIIAVAESKGYKVDEILLVGGSTRMPQVAIALAEKCGIEPKMFEPEFAVAKGAAIYAQTL